MSLRAHLEAIVAGMPDGSSVSLPVQWIRRMMEEDGQESAGPGSLLTLEDVAQATGRAVSTVRSWCNQGTLEGAFRLNNREWKIPENALREYLDRQATGDATRPTPSSVEAPVDLGSWRSVREKKGRGA